MTVRLLASSSRNLSSMVDGGLFRKDLYYRLNVVSLRIPPLRERGDDVALLAEHFLERLRRESGVHYSFSPDAMHTIFELPWPGNVRGAWKMRWSGPVRSPAVRFSIWAICRHRCKRTLWRRRLRQSSGSTRGLLMNVEVVRCVLRRRLFPLQNLNEKQF